MRSTKHAIRSSKRRRSIKTNRRKSRIAPRTADEFFAQPEEFQTDWEDMLRVVKRMRTKRLSLTKAAKQEGVNPRMVTRLGGRALKRRSNRSYAVTKRDSLLRVMQVPTPQGLREVALRNSREASILGQYWEAVQKYLRTGDSSELGKFRRKHFKDASGQEVFLITDLHELDRLASAGVLSFENIYSRST